MEPNYNQPFVSYYKPTNKFAMVSMILGICSLVFLCTIFLPLVIGALGIIFAILSKRRGQKMEGPAVTGVVTSSLGMGVSLIFCIVSLVSASIMLQPENRHQLNQMYEDSFGMTYEEYIEELYGEEMLEQMNDMFD